MSCRGAQAQGLGASCAKLQRARRASSAASRLSCVRPVAVDYPQPDLVTDNYRCARAPSASAAGSRGGGARSATSEARAAR